MKTVDSDQARQNEKAFNEKKEQNQKQFVELCYKELYNAIEMHHNVMKYIADAKQRAEDEDRKKFYQQKAEEAFNASIESYNAAIAKALGQVKEIKDVELGRLQALLAEMAKRIQELQSYIKVLDQKINEIDKKLEGIKKDLYQEMKQYFTASNPDINIRTQLLNLILPEGLGTNKMDIEINRDMYLRFTDRVIEHFATHPFHQFADQARAMAIETIKNEIAAKLTDLPKDKRELVTQEIMSHKSNQQKISTLADQLTSQLARDMSKNPAIASRIKEGSHYEREKEKLINQKQAAEIEKNKLVVAFNQATESLSDPKRLTSSDVTSILSKVEASRSKLMESKEELLVEASLTVLDKTDEYAHKANEIVEKAKEALTADPATSKVADSISAIQELRSDHQEALATGFDFLSNDEAVKPERQSDSPSLK